MFCLIFCFSGWTTNAQISGQVENIQGKPIPYANIRLFQLPDTILLTGVLTDSLGRFSVSGESKTDIINIQAVGYQSAWLAPDGISTVNSGIIRLEAYSVELASVEIQATKQLVQQTLEGMVINVQSSPLTKGSSALQVLERSPGLFIDRRNSNLSLNGQSGVGIMINGKLMRMSVAELTTLLEGMSADNLEKIELLTSPSAKYDAEGSAGLVNIVLKKNTNPGTQGSFSLSGGYGWREKESTSLQLSHSGANTTLYGNYAFNHDHTYSDFQGIGTERVPVLGGNVRFDFLNQSERKLNSHNAMLGMDQQLGKNTIVGGNLRMVNSRNISMVKNVGSYDIEPDSFIHMDIGVDGANRWKNFSGNLYWEQKIRTKSTLSLHVDYLRFDNRSPSHSQSNFSNKTGENIFPEGNIYALKTRGESQTQVEARVVKVDWNQKVNKQIEWDSGIKATFSQTQNRSQLEQLDQAQWVRDSRSSLALQMREIIGAAYLSTRLQLSPEIRVLLGIRYENWSQDFDDESLSRRASAWFPSLIYSHQLSEKNSYGFSYTKRISRPDYNDLASFLQYNGPISVFTGNPLLQPTISQQVKLTYQHNAYHLAVIGRHEKNPIARYQIAENDSSDLVLITPQNLAWHRSLSLQADISQELFEFWRMNIGIAAGFRQFQLSHTPTPTQESYFGINLYGNTTITLPQSFSLELSGWYNTRSYNGSVELEGFGMLNGGIQKQLPGNGGTFQLSVTDLLKSMNVISYLGNLTEEAFQARARVHFRPESTRSRIIRLTYTHTLGNSKTKKNNSRKSAAEEERSRVRIE